MASKTLNALALFLTINLVLFNFTAATYGTCPRDTLQIEACANVLNLVNLNIGSAALQPCCSLIHGLVDLEAAVCLCSALKLSVLGIIINVPINLSLALNACGRTVPHGFQCH